MSNIISLENYRKKVNGAVFAAVGGAENFYWYATDIRKSTSSILKSDSTAEHCVKRIRDFSYDPYGETTNAGHVYAEPEMDEIAFTGGVFDKELGLYYLMSRYYDPFSAQFISEDSYRGDGEKFWNLYMYCEGDPVNRTDRNGEYGAWVATKAHLNSYAKYNVGKAQSFSKCKNSFPNANCVGYAFEKNKILHLAVPGNYHKAKAWFPSLAKCAKANKRWIRLLSSSTSRIFPNERRVAFRCYSKDHTFKLHDGRTETTHYEYHLMRQLNTGYWSDRNGNGVFRNGIKNPDVKNNWPRAGDDPTTKLKESQKEDSPYDSSTLYFAISLKKYKMS